MMRKIVCLVSFIAINSLCACKSAEYNAKNGDVDYLYDHESKTCVAYAGGDNRGDNISWTVPCENVIDKLSASDRQQMLADIKKMSAETEEFCVHPQPPVPVGQ